MTDIEQIIDLAEQHGAQLLGGGGKYEIHREDLAAFYAAAFAGGVTHRTDADRQTEAILERLTAVADAARVYYLHYIQDDAEDADKCVCGREQHERAAALRDALKLLPPNASLSRGGEADFGLKR